MAAPVHEIFPGEEPDDDTRFSIDFSCTQALDEDIMGLLNSYAERIFCLTISGRWCLAGQ